MKLNELIKACQNFNPSAQRELYDTFSPVLFSICKRYMKTTADAEDALSEALIIIFSKISDYQGKGSFEGWIKKITVNQCLMSLRKRRMKFVEIADYEAYNAQRPIAVDRLEAADILNLLDKLPSGYRTIFNLYVLEGYKHREIAELLGISINTSKSQLILAKKKLQHLISIQFSNDVKDA